MFCKKAILENLVKFTVKHLYRILFFNKVAGTNVSQWILLNLLEHIFVNKCQLLLLFIEEVSPTSLPLCKFFIVDVD